MLGFLIGAVIIAGLIVLAFIKANLRICHPNEILVFSGKKRTLKDGTVGRSIPRKRLKDQLGLFDPIQNNLFD